jgi:AraC-like DNA-binding protein
LETLAYEQGYRVKGVCRELGLCEGYFREIFVRDVGLSPKEWMAWERMVVARRLLGWGMDPMAVAVRLGFSHANSFRREFAETYGVTVSRFLEIRAGKLEA